jgi:hypothetical protein
MPGIHPQPLHAWIGQHQPIYKTTNISKRAADSSLAELDMASFALFLLTPLLALIASGAVALDLDKSHNLAFIESQSFSYNCWGDQLEHNRTHTSQQKPQNKASSSN